MTTTQDEAQLAVRRQWLAKARRVVVKVGSAVLTGKTGIDEAIIEQLAEQISQLMARGLQVALVSSGAVAAGRGVICASEKCRVIKGMPDRQAASAVGQSRLMHAYDQAFGRRGIVTAQLLLTRDDLRSPRRFLNARNTFGVLFNWAAVPVVNENDTVVVEELEFGDNDTLAALLLNVVEGDLLVNLTSADGVYTANPAEDPAARRLDHIDDIDSLNLEAMCSGKTAVGTGGMYSKLRAARRAAQLGAPTLIVSGRIPGALVRAMDGEALGTFIVPHDKSIPQRKYRLAYNAVPVGTLLVDDGAARALTSNGKSLLPIGIRAVEGSFGRGALVRICGLDGRCLGVGLANYRAQDLRKIMGKKLA
ncbi:MAG: glutamate 5-kinase, partial [Desulfovibrio sp.]|nr:glutamate 5-kinase [Desulfovibrio sp.]